MTLGNDEIKQLRNHLETARQAHEADPKSPDPFCRGVRQGFIGGITVALRYLDALEAHNASPQEQERSQ